MLLCSCSLAFSGNLGLTYLRELMVLSSSPESEIILLFIKFYTVLFSKIRHWIIVKCVFQLCNFPFHHSACYGCNLEFPHLYIKKKKPVLKKRKHSTAASLFLQCLCIGNSIFLSWYLSHYVHNIANLIYRDKCVRGLRRQGYYMENMDCLFKWENFKRQSLMV